VSFGHFGDTELGGSSLKRARAFAALMNETGARGGGFYADAAYLTHGLDNPTLVKNALYTLFRETASNPAPLARRLMYGSDWEMLLIEGGNTDAYLTNFEEILRKLDPDTSLGSEGRLSDGFFGMNAARHLQLRSSDPNSTRGRLDRFYATHRVPKPAWQIKVDGIATLNV
jgi:hypothetical protein